MTTPITGQGLNVCIPPDDELSSTSKKAAQNKVITEEFTNVSKAINDLCDGIHTEIVNWEHGNISQNDGQNVNPAQTSRARAIGYISTDYAITVDRTTIAYEVYIYYYDANKDFVFRTSGYRDSAIAPNKNYAYYRITILNSSAEAATIDVSRLKTDITFVKKLTFDSQDIYTQVGVFTDRSLFKRNTVGRGAGGTFAFENSQTRIATNPVVRTTAKSYRITPTTGYKYVFYTCSDETHLDPEYSQQSVWRTEENTFKISDNINYVILIIAKTDNSVIYTDDFDKVTVTAEETVQYAINDVYAKIAEAKDDDLLPNYWKEYFNTKETALESADIGLGFNGVSLAFITDIHLGKNNKISPLLLKYITTHTNVRYVVCGGDIVTNVSTKDVALSELNWWMQKTSGLDIVNLHGNHDGNSNNQPDNTQIISDAEFYGLCCRQSENVVNWEHNSLFGYRDNQVQKMRFIYLDTGAPDSAVISNAQIEWMQGKISELPTGWFVLVFCHQFWTGVGKSTSTLPLDVNGTKILNALETIYDTANATICGVIVGHCHRNYSLISAKGFPVIATTCDTSGTGSSIYDPDTPNRTSETTEEQVIDLFYVNTSARTINTIRIGDGDTEQDRSFTF
ncbi:MAG: metallophosphoesterase [Clostridia bacterium]|nr:metallophosphoesterase [Clostridia bacterium]